MTPAASAMPTATTPVWLSMRFVGFLWASMTEAEGSPPKKVAHHLEEDHETHDSHQEEPDLGEEDHRKEDREHDDVVCCR